MPVRLPFDANGFPAVRKWQQRPCSFQNGGVEREAAHWSWTFHLSHALVWHLERLANRSSLPCCPDYSYLATACCGSFLYLFLPRMNPGDKYKRNKNHWMLIHHHKKCWLNVHGSLRLVLQSSQPLDPSKGWKMTQVSIFASTSSKAHEQVSSTFFQSKTMWAWP